MISTVDQKYNTNLFNMQLAETQIGWLQAELDSLTYDQSDRREVIRHSIQILKDTYNAAAIEIEAKEWGQQVSVRSNDNFGQICYGEVRTGGYITFMSADEGDNGNFIHTLVTLTCHEIDGFQAIYIDGNELQLGGSIYPSGAQWSTGDYDDLIFVSCRNRGTTSQVANSDLVSQSAALFPGKFTSAHRQRGCAGVYLLMMYSFDAFPNGLPEIAIQFKGKNDIYDPRDSSTGWSNNTALCLANYITDSNIGLGFSWDEIDEPSLIQAANDCDGLVTLKDGSTEKRYTCNGVFSASNSNNHKTIKEQLELTMAGSVVWSGDKWVFSAGKYKTPVCDLTESDLRSDIKIVSKPSARDVTNRIKGQYRGDLTNWEWGDFPPVTNATYKTQDGNRDYWQEQNFVFVSSSSQCQRISKILLEQSRQWIEVEATFSPAILQARAGDNVTLTLGWAGWNKKVFRIVRLSHVRERSGSGYIDVVSALLRETASGVYDWANGEETKIDLAPNTQLPDPRKLPTPQNLTLESGTEQLDIRSDGTVFSRLKLSWDSTTNPYILTDGVYRIQYKKSIDASYRDYGVIDGTLTNCWVLDVADGISYDVRVRAETSGGRSGWATVTGYIVSGKLEKPSTPSNLVATMDKKGITLTWDGITDLDLAGYEIRSGATFGSGSYIDITRSTSYLIPTQAAGVHYFTVAAKDTSKLYSDAVAVSIEIIKPSAVLSLRGLVLNNMVQMTWLEPLNFSFPIKEYQIRKGATFASAEVLGTVSATIKTIQEFLAGTYTYWIAAIDEHGNTGTEASITLYVDAPPLFELKDYRDIDFSDYITLTNALVEGVELVAPINTTETYQEHFDDNSWSTPQDQVDAGYPLYGQPVNVGDGVFECVLDFEETIPSVLISLTYIASWVDGSGDITPRISYSADDVTYTDGADGAVQVIGTSFRYVKVKFTISGDDNTSIARIGQAQVRLEIKTTNESGITSAVSTDASGTLVEFDNTFLDIFEGSFKPAYVGSSAYFPSYTIVGNEVRVFLWNVSGARVSGNVSWSIDGIVSTV